MVVFRAKRVVYVATIQRERAQQNREKQNPKVKELTVQIIQRNPKSKIIGKASKLHPLQKTHLPKLSLHDWTSKSTELFVVRRKKEKKKYILLLLNRHIPARYKQIFIYFVKI